MITNHVMALLITFLGAATSSLMTGTLLTAGRNVIYHIGVFLLQRYHPAVQRSRFLDSSVEADPALVRDALHHLQPVTSLRFLVTAIVITTSIASLGFGFLAPLWAALLSSIGMAALLMMIAVRIAWTRYITKLDRQLTQAVGMLSAEVSQSKSLSLAIRDIAYRMESPLRDEWLWMFERQSSRMSNQRSAPIRDTFLAMAHVTPSDRHRWFLLHMAAVFGLTQEAQAQRCRAAHDAMLTVAMQRDQIATELAQIRYSGIAVGAAGVFLTVYLAVTQWERFIRAYGSPIGIMAGVIIALAIVAPALAGFWLSRVEDLDY